MAYTVTTSSGATLATVADGTVNNSATSITLIGKNYAGYGIFLNENYVKLLENFSNGTAPTSPITGQLWYDSSSKVLRVYDSSISAWKPISTSATGGTAPASPIIGDMWWDSANAQLKVYSGSAWITIGPSYTSTAGTSGAVVETILDTPSGGSHVIVKFYISNSVIAILSKDTQFTPATAIAGFTSVKPGLNLISTSALPNSQFTGDASNALALGGVTASQFLRSDQNAITSYAIQAGAGVTVGSDLAITSGANAIIFNSTTNSKDVDIYVNRVGVTTKAIGIAGSTAAVTFSNAVSVTGALGVTGACTHNSTTLLSGATTFGAQALPNANNTIEIGSNSMRFANVWATTFRGTAITAQYADLAERFEADAPYTPGTVVEIGGIKEITAAVKELSESVFGVISTLPGFLLNGTAGDDKTHPAVAVNGRVPVRVVGQVKKGDRLVSAGNGLARAASRSELTAFNVLGRALEDKTTLGEGLVEAIVKLNS